MYRYFLNYEQCFHFFPISTYPLFVFDCIISVKKAKPAKPLEQEKKFLINNVAVS